MNPISIKEAPQYICFFLYFTPINGLFSFLWGHWRSYFRGVWPICRWNRSSNRYRWRGWFVLADLKIYLSGQLFENVWCLCWITLRIILQSEEISHVSSFKESLLLRVLQYLVCEEVFVNLPVVNLLFYSPSGDQSINCHILFLSNTPSTFSCLLHAQIYAWVICLQRTSNARRPSWSDPIYRHFNCKRNFIIQNSFYWFSNWYSDKSSYYAASWAHQLSIMNKMIEKIIKCFFTVKIWIAYRCQQV